MKKLFLGVLAAATFYSGAQAKTTEKFFIVERESSSIAIVEHGLPRAHLEGMHNMNHGVVKFDGKDGYVISRDGYIMKFDPIEVKKIKEYKTSDSAIGFTISKNFIAVANYAKKSVDILDRDLNPLQSFDTGSRNVGIKIYKNYLIFAQMDNDKLTVLKDKNEGKGKPNFEIYKEFKDVGIMPFDAMINGKDYIVGFFTSKHFGVINLDTMTFKKIDILLGDRQPVLKVPHFGFWSISGDKIFIPAVGDNKLLVYDKDFNFIQNIDIEGTPVFSALSPDEKYVAVTFSGKKFPVIQIVDTATLKVIKRFEFDGKVLHLRWSKEAPSLYVSVNDTNKVAVIDTKKWFLKREIFQIKKPSGIFLFEEEVIK